MVNLHKFRPLYIFDTTLRDGEQAPGYSMTVEQKIQLALELENLGVNTIETGFPMSSSVDFEATQQICKLLKKAQPCAFSRAASKDIENCAKAMKDANNPQIEIATVTSDIHMFYKRKMTRDMVVQEVVDAVDCAKAMGFQDISLGLEDATRGDIKFLRRLIGETVEHGATVLVVPDTVGCCLPNEFYNLITQLRDFVGNDVKISVHCHDDMGLAIANSIAGVMAGADEVQTTLCGIGERAGNASLEELIAILNTKRDTLHRVHDIITHKIYGACNLLIEMLDLKLPLHKAIIGHNAFSSEAGMHQQGLLKSRFTYEWLRAEDYGTNQRIAIGRHSGRNVIKKQLMDKGIQDIDHCLVDYLYEEIVKDSELEKYNSSDFLVERYKALKNQEKLLKIAC
jgi:2-isopropylmalate synthase